MYNCTYTFIWYSLSLCLTFLNHVKVCYNVITISISKPTLFKITCLLPRQLYEDLPIRYCANALISTIRENKPINSAISNRKEGSYRQIPNRAVAKTNKGILNYSTIFN